MNKMSYMIAIPQCVEDIIDIDRIIHRIENSGFTELIDDAAEDTLRIKVTSDIEEYEASISSTDFEIPPMYRKQHFFTDIDLESIQNNRLGVMIAMEFGDDSLNSYHTQLKIIETIVPNVVAVLDINAEKIISGNWVRLAVKSSVPPSPKYIYTIQAILGDGDGVWLHTHGLNRCGLPEIEILDSSKELYHCHSSVITTMASRMLELDEPLEEKEPIYLAMMTDIIPLYAALVDWREYVERSNYKKDHLGGLNDRKNSHNKDTMVICCFPTPKELEAKEPLPLFHFDELFAEGNPLFMISSVETARMKALAAERVDYIRRFSNKPNTTVLVKIGLTVDEEFQNEANEHEHIWFELLSIDKDTLTGRLTQNPYYVKGMSEGSIGTYSFDQITDWVILTNDRQYTPDDCYLLELQK